MLCLAVIQSHDVGMTSLSCDRRMMLPYTDGRWCRRRSRFSGGLLRVMWMASRIPLASQLESRSKICTSLGSNEWLLYFMWWCTGEDGLWCSLIVCPIGIQSHGYNEPDNPGTQCDIPLLLGRVFWLGPSELQEYCGWCWWGGCVPLYLLTSFPWRAPPRGLLCMGETHCL